MYTTRWIIFLIRRSLYGTFRVLSSRLWLLVGFFVLVALWGENDALAQFVLIGGMVVYFTSRVAAGNIGPGERPQRPLGYVKPVKEKPAPVAASRATVVDSPSAEIARRRLPAHLQAILTPTKGAP